MDLLDRFEDHRRRTLDRPAYQVPLTVSLMYLGKPPFDWHELAVGTGRHVATGQHAGQCVWRRFELAADSVSESAFPGFDDGARVMGDQSAEHGIGVLRVTEEPDAVE